MVRHLRPLRHLCIGLFALPLCAWVVPVHGQALANAYGDTTLDGSTNGVDFNQLTSTDSAFGITYTIYGGASINGVVNSAGFGNLASNFGAPTQVTSADSDALDAFAQADGLTSVPEPASASLALIAGIGFLARRRRAQTPHV